MNRRKAIISGDKAEILVYFFTKSFINIHFLCRRHEETRLVHTKEDPRHFFLLHDTFYDDRCSSG